MAAINANSFTDAQTLNKILAKLLVEEREKHKIEMAAANAKIAFLRGQRDDLRHERYIAVNYHRRQDANGDREAATTHKCCECRQRKHFEFFGYTDITGVRHKSIGCFRGCLANCRRHHICDSCMEDKKKFKYHTAIWDDEEDKKAGHDPDKIICNRCGIDKMGDSDDSDSD